jgi:ABC-type molybdate transport system substrate-binding protein
MATKTYRVKLKRVIYAEVRVEAESAADAKRQVEDGDPHDWFITAPIGGTDTTTIVSAKVEST